MVMNMRPVVMKGKCGISITENYTVFTYSFFVSLPGNIHRSKKARTAKYREYN